MSQEDTCPDCGEPHPRPRCGKGTSIQRREEIALGSYRETRLANQAMEAAQYNANLITPATSVGAMPEGCSIAFSKVEVDTTRNEKGWYLSKDTYDVGGQRGLSKTVLQKIGAALGVSWDPAASGRVDDGSDANYCRWKAVGTYRSFDGQVQVIVGEKEMDLRDGSPQLQALWERFDDKAKYPLRDGEKPPKPPVGQIREMRLHIQSHCETKAQLRALRSMGIKTSYSHEELRRPFVAARVMFTGQTEDPALRTMFAEKLADSFLDSKRSLYGAAPVTQQTQPLRLRPPPVGSVVDDDDDGYVERGHMADRAAPTVQTQPVQTQPAQQPAQAQQQQPAQAQQQQPAQQTQPAQAQKPAARSGHKMPFGRSVGKDIEDAPDGDLQWMIHTIGAKLADGSARYPDKDQIFVDAMMAESTKRKNTADRENSAGGY